MNDENRKIFEQTTLEFLSSTIQTSPGGSKITIDSLIVTNQSVDTMTRRLSNTDIDAVHTLTVTFDVTASLILDDTEGFDFSALLSDFFADSATVLALRDALKTSSTFFVQGTQGTLASSVEEDRGPQSTKTGETKNLVSIAGALIGVAVTLAGSAAMFLWIRGRKSDDVPRLNRAFSGDLEDQSDFSVPSRDGYQARHLATSPKESEPPTTPGLTFGQFTWEDSDEREQNPNEKASPPFFSPVETVEANLMPGVSDFYKPVFISMESNIEIPDTPVSERKPSIFTPTSLQLGEFALDVTSSPELLKTNSSDELKKELKNVPFFSPQRLLGGTKRKGKQAKEQETKKSRSNVSPTRSRRHTERSGRSPVRSDVRNPRRSPIRNDIRRHDIIGDVDMYSLASDEQNPSQEAQDNSLCHPSPGSSISVRNEVAYIHSMEEQRAIMRSQNAIKQTVQGLNTARNDHSGRVEFFHRKRGSGGYISDESAGSI
jgi:hypothetical protein